MSYFEERLKTKIYEGLYRSEHYHIRIRDFHAIAHSFFQKMKKIKSIIKEGKYTVEFNEGQMDDVES